MALLSVYLHSPDQDRGAEFTAANYAKLWEPYYANLFLRTVRLAVVVTAVCMVLGYPVAYFLARSTSRIMTLGLSLLIMPLLVSTVIRVFGWVVILGSEGLVNQGLRLLGAGEGVRLLYTEGAVIIGLTQQSLPFMVLPIMAAIERISPSLEEAAQNLGASWGQMFARVIVPLSMPGLVSGALLVFSVSMSAFITLPDRRPPRADGGPADLRGSPYRLRLAGCGELDDRPVGVDAGARRLGGVGHRAPGPAEAAR